MFQKLVRNPFSYLGIEIFEQEICLGFILFTQHWTFSADTLLHKRKA